MHLTGINSKQFFAVVKQVPRLHSTNRMRNFVTAHGFVNECKSVAAKPQVVECDW